VRPAAVALAFLALLPGCTLGPDPARRPVTAADTAPRYAEARGPAGNQLPGPGWWRHFADPVTAKLVKTALAGNADVRAAAARVLQAQASLQAASGSRWPTADFQFTANRNKFSFVLPQVGRVGIFSTTFSGQLSVSYQVDLFGRLARTRQAAWARLLAAEADRRTVVNGLIAQVIRTRVLVASLQQQIATARRLAASWKQTRELTEQRYAAGLIDAAEVHLVRSSAAAAEAAVPPLERQLAAARHALDILLGRRPGTGGELPATLPPVPDLEPIPVGLPASLIDRRPDLVAARMRLAAATAEVGVALANLYPGLTLSAAGGRTGNTINELSHPNTEVYNAVLSLLAPLFRGGQLRAQVRLSRAQAEEAASQYAGAVLKALGEVEDALAADRLLQDQLEAVERQAAAARAALGLARWRYEAGEVTLLDLLAADRASRQAELALIAVRASLWDNRVALHLALGGDWSAADAAAPASKPASKRGATPPSAHHERG